MEEEKEENCCNEKQNNLYEYVIAIGDLFASITRYLDDSSTFRWIRCDKAHVKKLKWIMLTKHYNVTLDLFKLGNKGVRFRSLESWHGNVHCLRLWTDQVHCFVMDAGMGATLRITNEFLRNLPKGLKKLQLKGRFNFDPLLKGTDFPASLTHFDAGSCFCIPTRLQKDFFPSSLQSLALQHDSSNIDPTALPESLTRLHLENRFGGPGSLPHTYPPLLIDLYLNGDIDFDAIEWPPSLQKLELGYLFNRPFPPKNPFFHLKTLHLGQAGSWNHSIDALPPCLEDLHLGRGFNQPLKNLPPGLVALRFEYESSFNQPIDLPNSIKYLNFGFAFNQPLVSAPSSLITLTLGQSFVRFLPIFAPPFQQLTFPLDGKFDRPFLHPFPASLLRLDLPAHYNHLDPGLFIQIESFNLNGFKNKRFELKF